MDIRSIHIYGFGKFHDFTLDLRPGLNVIEGDNESGKSTLFSFVKSIFFGFASRRFPEERYEPFAGGRFGGRIALVNELGERYEVERVARNTSLGTAKVALPNGTEHGEETLKTLLSGMSPSFYANVYAFGLSELSYLTSLSHEEVANYLYRAGTSVSLPAIKKSWNDELDRLFKSRGTQPLINRHLTRLEEIERQIQALRDDNESYNEWLTKRDQVDREIRRLELKMDQYREEQRIWEKAKEAYDLLKERKAALERLSELPPLTYFPENGDRRLADLDQRAMTLTVEIEDEQRRLDEIDRELAELPIRSEINQSREEIESLTREGERWIEKQEELSSLAARVEWTIREWRRNLDSLGLDWTEQRLKEFNVSFGQKEKFRSWRERFEQLRARLRATQERMRFNRAELEEVRGQWIEARDEANRLKSERQLTEMAERLSIGRQLWTELNADRQQMEWLESRFRSVSVPERRSRTLAYSALAAAGLVVGAALFYFYRFQWETIVLLITTLAVVFLLVRRSNGERRGEVSLAKRNRKELREKIEEKQRRLQQLMAPFGGAFDLARLERLETQVNEERALLWRQKEKIDWLKERLDRLETQLKGLEEQERALLDEQKDWERQWRSRLKEYFLPVELSPDGALELLSILEKAKEELLTIELEKEKLERAQSDWKSYQTKLGEWYERLFNEKREDPLFMLREIKLFLRQQDELRERKSALETEKKERIASNQKRTRLLEKIKEERAALLAQVSATDSESFLKAHRQYTERVEILEKIRMLDLTLDIADADKQIENIVESHSLETIERKIEYWREQWERVRQQWKQAVDRRGQCADRLRQLERNDQLSMLNQQRQELLTAAEEDAKKWVALRVAIHLLNQTQAVYEAREQPRVLKEASAYFARMTEGRYHRAFSPVGEERLLVERQDGTRLDPKFLSRGAREQLFLSLRLGLIRATSDAGALPILLDDVLVNFDERRHRAALRCISQLTPKHQILYFTSSPRCARFLDELGLPFHRTILST